ncbi:MAG: hypothetical protein E2O51_06560 [Gammaproteobacteria bacterium]|nr:MAG: hypothetical protein E2O51_06560 [Gammaproteobacteria bacterium]
MNITRVVAVVTLTLSGLAAAQAGEVIPAWRTDGFLMEEIVVTAKAPDRHFINEIAITPMAPMMEEIVVSAEAPASDDMEEIVVTATAPQLEESVVALETPEVEVTPVPVIEEIVATARSEEHSSRLATRLRSLWDVRHF